MKINNLQNKGLFRTILFLLLYITGVGKCLAANYDFSAVAPSGQTLYYKITDNNTHEIQVTYPGGWSWKYRTSSSSGYWYSSHYSYWHLTSYYSFNKPDGNIIIPSHVEYNGILYTVTSIGANAFHGGEIPVGCSSSYNSSQGNYY